MAEKQTPKKKVETKKTAGIEIVLELSTRIPTEPYGFKDIKAMVYGVNADELDTVVEDAARKFDRGTRMTTKFNTKKMTEPEELKEYLGL